MIVLGVILMSSIHPPQPRPELRLAHLVLVIGVILLVVGLILRRRTGGTRRRRPASLLLTPASRPPFGWLSNSAARQ